MPVAILFPSYDHPAIEERYASWQSETLLRRDGPELHRYDFNEPAQHALIDVDSPHTLVVTDPLLLASPQLPERLAAVLDKSNAFAALPSSTQSSVAAQMTRLPPYMTLREFEIETTSLQKVQRDVERLTWDGSNAGAFLCRTADLREIRTPLADVLKGRDVVISHNDFIHRWASLRGDGREDLLARIAPDARSVLEFGCGEGALGSALKARQKKVRVVCIELNRRAAALAKKRLDDVYQGDALEIVSILHEKFDWIVGGYIVEHLAEPWTFLADLRRLATDDGHLLLSIPNLANASIIADLLHGRFDYVYMGLTCAGHLRFFTRRSIEEMLTIAGWDVQRIEPQELTVTHERDALIATLEKASIPFSKEDLVPTGYYVTARKRR